VVKLLDAGYQVFVDEAYYEFCGETMIDLIARFPKQLVISRTLSKFCAMSGSRVGYIIADASMIASLHTLKMLFNVNSEGQQRALFALRHMDEFHEAVQSLKASKAFIEEELKKIGEYELFSALDLYVIFKHATIPSLRLHRILSEKYGIETYLFENFKGYSVLRVAVAKPEVMQRLVDALRNIIAK
jgi:histidinol-phosphate aminotransferase